MLEQAEGHPTRALLASMGYVHATLSLDKQEPQHVSNSQLLQPLRREVQGFPKLYGHHGVVRATTDALTPKLHGHHGVFLVATGTQSPKELVFALEFTEQSKYKFKRPFFFPLKRRVGTPGCHTSICELLEGERNRMKIWLCDSQAPCFSLLPRGRGIPVW